MRPKFNGGALGGGDGTQGAIAQADADGYGSIALCAGGSTHAHFKGLRYKDLLKRDAPKETVGSNYRMQRLARST